MIKNFQGDDSYDQPYQAYLKNSQVDLETSKECKLKFRHCLILKREAPG